MLETVVLWYILINYEIRKRLNLLLKQEEYLGCLFSVCFSY